MRPSQLLLGAFSIAVAVAGCAPPPATNIAQPTTNGSTQAATAGVETPAPAMQSMQPPTGVATTGQFEEPAVINAADFLPASALSGNGYNVQPQVPTNGAMGQYTIVADSAVFHDDAGTYRVESLEMLKLRLSEIPAIAQLESMNKAGVFAKELATSAERPVSDAAQMVVHPMDTVTGLPTGVGQFFERVNLGTHTLYSTATNASESGGERASQTAGEAAEITVTALGYDDVRRELAKKLQVDPYTSNPVLKQKLNQYAWVMFSARVGVNAIESVAVPGSMVISGVEITDDLVYQTPRAELIVLVEQKLKTVGLSQEQITTFSHNNAIPLSLQVTAVRQLESLGKIPGRRDAAVALANVLSEYQARFLVAQLKMFNQWSRQRSQITHIGVAGPLVARDSRGNTIMPAPVDYISWTPRIAGFATDPDLLHIRNRVIWVPNGMTPLTRQQLAANGWSVHEGAQP